MITAVICTQNPGKVKELSTLFPGADLTIMDKDVIVPPEIGVTLLDNARIKAVHGSMLYPESWVIADDSGLEVDCLDGAPGVYSARFAGVHGDNSGNNAMLIETLKKHTAPYTARFACVLIAISPEGEELLARGEVEGEIILTPRGEEGFGYDPLFVPKGHSKTFAELPLAIKQTMSHRARAAKKLYALMQDNL